MGKRMRMRRRGIVFRLLSLALFGTSLIIPGVIDDADVIRQRMMALGFLECNISTQRDGSYSIKVNAYAERSQALSLDGVFRPFEVRAKYSSGILYLEKSDIEKAGFSIDEGSLPRGVKIVGREITARSPQMAVAVMDADIQRIERALEETKRNRKRVFANCRAVVSRSSQTFAVSFPDVCKTPSTPGPIPIPYPDIAKSSDTAQGSKKVKADMAEAMAKDSSFKMSESDELGTRMSKLERAYKNIVAKRELTPDETAKFKRELKTCLDKAALLKKTLDVYVAEIEKLLRSAKK